MTECNHECCTSPFCPRCGEALGSEPLQDLRRHCARNRDKALRYIKRIEGWTECVEEVRVFKIKREQETAHRWGRYVTALDECRSQIAMLTEREKGAGDG